MVGVVRVAVLRGVPSPGGRYRSVYPILDGTGRLLVSWSQCRVVEDQLNVPCTEARLSDPAVDRLKNSSAMEVVVTNTLPVPPDKQFDKLTTLSIAPLIARAIREVFEDGSVTSMFDGHA